MTSTLLVFLFGAIASTLLAPLARSIARRCDVVDYSDGIRKLHPQPAPLLGGVAIFLAFGLSIAACMIADSGLGEHGRLATRLLLAGGMACLIGLCDDIWGLRVRWKLLGQFTAASLIVWQGGLYDGCLIFGQTFEFGQWYAVMAVIWIVACMNAMNFLDGADGLATTIGIAASANIATLALVTGQTSVAWMALALAGSLFGFLRFNRWPAKIFLGDAGSLTIGMLLSILAVGAAAPPKEPEPVVAIFGVVFVLLFDLTLAVARRLLEGNHIWIADRGHLHHRLMEHGRTPPQAVNLLGILTLTAGIMTLAAVHFVGEWFGWLTLVGIVVYSIRNNLGGTHEWRLTIQATTKLAASLRQSASAAPEPTAPQVFFQRVSLQTAEPLRGPFVAGREKFTENEKGRADVFPSRTHAKS